MNLSTLSIFDGSVVDGKENVVSNENVEIPVIVVKKEGRPPMAPPIIKNKIMKRRNRNIFKRFNKLAVRVK